MYGADVMTREQHSSIYMAVVVRARTRWCRTMIRVTSCFGVRHEKHDRLT